MGKIKDILGFKKKEEPKKKRSGGYRQKECPYCHKHFGNVNNHIKMAHKAEAEAAGRDITPASKKEITKEDLLAGKKPPEENPEDKVYYCTNCKAELRKGENPCWNCQELLKWEGIE